MKPLHLTVQAFGPFADTQTIDFAQLPLRAPFAISGPTGAGKTSILDAMCLALFGDTSGGERSGSDMRSHHADEHLPTEVSLVFALGDATWRVTRRPARRLERRTEAQSVQLELQVGGGQWQPQSQRVAEVDAKIRALLGFDVAQFRQVVVLPQGAFRQLLTANSTQREGILKQLFGTHLYERVQFELGQREKALRDEATLLTERKRTLLDQHGAGKVEDLAALRTATEQELEAARTLSQHAEVVRQQAELALRTGQRDAELLRECEAMARKLAEHQQLLPEQQQREGALRAARQAQQAAPQVQLAAQAHEQLHKAKTLLAAATAARGTLAPQAAQALSDLENQRARSGEREQHLAQAAKLEALADKVAGLDAARAKSLDIHRKRDTATAASSALAGKVQVLEQTLPVKQAEHARLYELAAALPSHAAQVQKLLRIQKLSGDMQAAARAVKNLQNDFDAAQQAHTRAVQAEQQALQAHNSCHAAWVRGQAARLALELKEREPCAVCGSCDHPAPAQAHGELVSDQELDRSKQAFERARAQAGERTTAVAKLAAQLEAAVAAHNTAQAALAAEELDPSQADAAALERAKLAVAQAEAASRQVAEAKAAIDAVQGDLDAARLQQKAAEAAAADLGAQAAAAQQAVQALEADLPEPLRSPAALQAAIQQSTRAAKALLDALEAAQRRASELQAQLAGAQGTLQTRQEALASAATEVAKADQECEQALQSQGFATHADWNAARLEPAPLAALQQRIDAWQARLAELRGLSDKAAELAANVVEPNLMSLAAASEAAKVQDTEAQHGVASLVGRIRQLVNTQDLLAELATKAGDLEVRYGVVKDLAATCAGDNPSQMPLQRFVLTGLLDDVLRAANLRLAHMTRSRYTLLRKEEIVDKRRAFGLDLEVLDAYTGQQRPATTLSGGEGFLASLALALGLSDVVQGYSGGIRLDALFIDEGFGTLDPETLELAIKALLDLTSGPSAAGRLVGIISHVPELKARLAKGIEVEVRADGKGSRVRVLQ